MAVSCSSTNSAFVRLSVLPPPDNRCCFSNELNNLGTWGFCSDNVFIPTPDSLLSERLVRVVIRDRASIAPCWAEARDSSAQAPLQHVFVDALLSPCRTSRYSRAFCWFFVNFCVLHRGSTSPLLQCDLTIQAAQQTEVYWMALARDVPFSPFASNDLIRLAAGNTHGMDPSLGATFGRLKQIC